MSVKNNPEETLKAGKRQVSRHPGGLEEGLSGGGVRPEARRSAATADRDHPVGPVHRQESQPGDAGALSQISFGGSLCPCFPGDPGAIDSFHRILPQQGQEHPGGLPAPGERAQRAGAANHGGAPRTPRSGPKKRPMSCLGRPFGVASGVVVDTHVFRISRRLGLTRARTPEKVEQDLMAFVPAREWINFSHRLIHHGRRVCSARSPQCSLCALEPHCRKVGVV